MTLPHRLHPPSAASRNVRRIIRRLRHEGFHPRRDPRGNPWPSAFRGIIGWVLELRAYRRKNGRGGWLPGHVGRDIEAKEERYYQKKIKP